MHIPTDGEAPSVLVEYLEGMSTIPILNDVPRERTLRGRVGCRLPTCSLLHALRTYIVYSVSFVWARSGHVLRVSDATHLARVSNGDIASSLEGSILAIIVRRICCAERHANERTRLGQYLQINDRKRC